MSGWRSFGLFGVLLGLVALPAAGVSNFQLVGFTGQKFAGNGGLLAMSTACQSQFPASRVCSSSEVANTVKLPAGLPGGGAWVQPSLVGGVLIGTVPGAVDAQGGVLPGTVPCGGWTRADNGAIGLAVTAAGQVTALTCDNALSAACCALTPVPEPPTSLAEPAAGVALASLAVTKAVHSAF